ncbi:DUF1232 domain-containing protein [Nocardioides sp. CER19]|uniref:YkvA family protein n=1 Tax=Nocardioides sp. CER19 TaxID=3038538 RepID=UPI002447B360|nr:DUF1232 domain-containing protein [Nocardioides sp. CER19]MDH2413725.1 DUF1232 domain-containing protein [Nocardioides sp. CER19]
MNPWLQALLAVLAGLLCLWVVLVAVLYLAGRRYDDPPRVREVLRLLPDVVRLLHRLVKDPALPRGVRVRVLVLLAYLALPIDLVPDFIPVIGYADDVVIVALTLRSVTRVAGADALDRHWPGTPEGLRAVKRLAGLAR